MKTKKVIAKKVAPKAMVGKKTAFDIKEASNQNLTASARNNYAKNAQAAMKNTKKKISHAKFKTSNK